MIWREGGAGRGRGREGGERRELKGREGGGRGAGGTVGDIKPTHSACYFAPGGSIPVARRRGQERSSCALGRVHMSDK